MLNHLHLLFSSPDAAGFVRDFKKFTSKELKKNIEATEPNILKLFFNKDKGGARLFYNTGIKNWTYVINCTSGNNNYLIWSGNKAVTIVRHICWHEN